MLCLLWQLIVSSIVRAEPPGWQIAAKDHATQPYCIHPDEHLVEAKPVHGFHGVSRLLFKASLLMKGYSKNISWLSSMVAESNSVATAKSETTVVGCLCFP